MSSPIPFIDPETRGLRTDQIKNESYRVAGLVALFGGVALVPFVFAVAFDDAGLGLLFLLVTQFVLAVGTAVVLMYVVARGVQLADTDPDPGTTRTRPPESDTE